MAELRQLRTFVAVAEELNFTRAAARLHLAQQAVSKTVRQLERELGVELLERTTREVRLTRPEPRCSRLRRESSRAADAARARAVGGRGVAGRSASACPPAWGRRERDEVAAALRAGAPSVGVAAGGPPGARSSGSARGGGRRLVRRPAAAPAPASNRVALRPTPAVLAVPAGHRLAQTTERSALAQLDGERVLTWSAPGTPYTDLLVAPPRGRRCARRGRSSRASPAAARCRSWTSSARWR